MSVLAVPIPNDEPRLTVIEARNSWNRDDLQELWRYRELFWHLTLRDIKIRYKQTILGLGWALVQPLATMLVFIVFIGWMGKVSAGIENYTLFVLCGVLPWTFFANAVTNSANSLLINERLVTKIFFPRVLLPGASVGAALFDFLIGLAVVVGWVLIAGARAELAIAFGGCVYRIALLDGLRVWFGTLGTDRGATGLSLHSHVRRATLDVCNAVHLPSAEQISIWPGGATVAGAQPRVWVDSQLSCLHVGRTLELAGGGLIHIGSGNDLRCSIALLPQSRKWLGGHDLMLRNLQC